MVESESHPLCRSDTHLNRQPIVVACGGVKLEMTLQHRKGGPLVLENRQGLADLPEELASRPLQQIKIAGMINVVSNRAIGIAHPVIPTKDVLRHADQFSQETETIEP